MDRDRKVEVVEAILLEEVMSGDTFDVSATAVRVVLHLDSLFPLGPVIDSIERTVGLLEQACEQATRDHAMSEGMFQALVREPYGRSW